MGTFFILLSSIYFVSYQLVALDREESDKLSVILASMTYLVELLTTACEELFSLTEQPELTRPDEQFGDFASNIALQLAKKIKQSPQDVAEKIKAYVEANNDGSIVKVEVAGPGFLNITLSDESIWSSAHASPRPVFKDQKILLEYSCPNAFKELHTGHLYQTIIGDVIGGLISQAGAVVFRANFGSDVGLPVAKSLYGIEQELGGLLPDKLADVKPEEHARWLSQVYVRGSQAYEDDPKAALSIKDFNKAVYQIHSNDDHDSPLAKIYWECRSWSYDYFKEFYNALKVAPFDKYYPESLVTDRGLEAVKAHIGDVFKESQGAIIFPGEDGGTHTRVFITSAKLPTYETKDLGVILAETDDFTYDRRVIMTGNDQVEYMKVVFAALAEIDGKLAGKQGHLSHGTIRFGDGKKMSSRLGNVTRAADVVDTVSKAVEAKDDKLRSDITLGAIKYAFLKHRIGGDIAFDVQESVSLQGNSGPYIQYAYARACSILAKASSEPITQPILEAGERSLVRYLSQYAEVVEQATREMSPHLICTYLYELAQVFNRFYENNRVIGDPRQAVRLSLVETYTKILKNGLNLLTIPTPEKM
ncbi:MAG: arginine--tRNA ligase [Candidatus Saccharibacteria bacterium]